MGIPQGITLIVGGGYHGKSTLLKAISLGVYNHVPGDGREQVVTDSTAVKIRAEDGRSVVSVDISPFINHLPQNRSTIAFSTENASGSTSQATNIMEALEVGAKVLLVDEDTSATNFMIRDRRMQALIAKDKEPITPLIDKIRQLYLDHQISTILVMGGSGDYFEVADTVIAMAEFIPENVTEHAKAIAAAYPTDRQKEGGETFGNLPSRMPMSQRLEAPRLQFSLQSGQQPKRWEDADPTRKPRIKVRDVDELVFGAEAIDLSAIEQIVETGQLRAIGAAITQLQAEFDGQRTLVDLLTSLIDRIKTKSLDSLTFYPQGDLTLFRSFELAAVINRLRSLQINQIGRI